jgi:hypothetical protein
MDFRRTTATQRQYSAILRFVNDMGTKVFDANHSKAPSKRATQKPSSVPSSPAMRLADYRPWLYSHDVKDKEEDKCVLSQARQKATA